MWLLQLPNGISPHNVLFWSDGFGIPDRINKTAYTETNIVRGGKARGGRILTFNGTDSKIDTGSDFIGTTLGTICAWIYPTGWGENTSSGRIIDNGKTVFYIDTNDDIVRLSGNGAVTASVSATNAIVLNQWTFVVGVKTSSTTGSMYVNGVLSGAPNQAIGTVASGNNVIIGNRASSDRTFAGDMTQIIGFDKVLTVAQIGQMYNKHKVGT